MKQDEIIARCYLAAAIAEQTTWAALEREACAHTGEGPLTSGIGNATRAPDDVKRALRAISATRNWYVDKSLAHWRKAGKRAHTWRRLRDEMEARA